MAVMRHFSIIIPAYNAENYLSSAVESALQQENVEYEIIIINDGSTDDTKNVAGRFGNRVRIINQENKGLSEARNTGARHAEGNILCFLDADDIWLPGKLSAQGTKIDLGFNIVYTNRYNFGEIGDLPEIQSDVVAMIEGDLWELLLYGNMITASSSVISKKLFEKIGGFNKYLRSCEDWDFWLRGAEENRIGYCPEPLVKYRIHAGGLSKNYMYMSEMRYKVLSNALSSQRARHLSSITKRRILASMWSTSGWDAAKAKDITQSLAWYARAVACWPFEKSIWYDIARCVTGRI